MYIDETLYHGAPDNVREEREERCYALLDRLGIDFYRVDHEHADTIEACHGIERVLGCRICKNLFLTNRQHSAFYLLLLPGDKPFMTKYLSRELGTARLSFADGTEMEKYLGLLPGSASILGLMNDRENAVRLVIDKELLGEKYLGCHPCLNTSTLRLSMDEVQKKLIPAMGHEPTFVELPREDEI